MPRTKKADPTLTAIDFDSLKDSVTRLAKNIASWANEAELATQIQDWQTARAYMQCAAELVKLYQKQVDELVRR